MRPPEKPQGKDECLRYSVAALLDRDVETVPHFVREPGYWRHVLRDWAQGEGYRVDWAVYQKREGSRVWTTKVPIFDELPRGEFIGIIAPRSRAHAVVMKGGEVIYDPSLRLRKRYQKAGIGIIQFVPVTT